MIFCAISSVRRNPVCGVEEPGTKTEVLSIVMRMDCSLEGRGGSRGRIPEDGSRGAAQSGVGGVVCPRRVVYCMSVR
jgi:hypothetical protein